MIFHENLMRLRKQKGLSQEVLGNEIHVARQTVSKWELGETTPDLEKLKALSELFEISVDELIGNDITMERDRSDTPRRTYEFVSKTTIGSLPLVHIHFGFGYGNIKKAKGIIAIGNIAQGVLAIGGIAMGLVALGGIGLGIFTLGGLAAGLLLAVGGLAVGSVAMGGLAIGLFAVGGLSLGIYAIGGCAIAKDIAYGGYASGHIAIGETTKGTVTFLVENNRKWFTAEEVEGAILKEFPNIWRVILSIFSNI